MVTDKKRLGAEMELHPPSRGRQVLERIGLREIQPSDLGRQDIICRHYRDLGGDQTAIGRGDDGDCQSWRHDRRWWKRFLSEHGVES